MFAVILLLSRLRTLPLASQIHSSGLGIDRSSLIFGNQWMQVFNLSSELYSKNIILYNKIFVICSTHGNLDGEFYLIKYKYYINIISFALGCGLKISFA